MTLVGFKAQNHRQQTAKRGPLDQVDDRGTPPELYDPLHARYQFTLDAAAAPHNAKCERFYTLADDGLTQPWHPHNVWCNPPYSNLGAWVAKAWAEFHPGEHVIVMLVPANRTEQGWWQDHVEPYRDRRGLHFRVDFLRGRTRFVRPGATEIGPNERPPFGCALLTWEATR